MRCDIPTSVAPVKLTGDGQHQSAVIDHLHMLRGFFAADLFFNQKPLLGEDVDKVWQCDSSCSLPTTFPRKFSSEVSPPEIEKKP
jgi:hypothetical protein